MVVKLLLLGVISNGDFSVKTKRTLDVLFMEVQTGGYVHCAKCTTEEKLSEDKTRLRNGNASCKKSECKSHGTGTMRLAASAEPHSAAGGRRDPEAQ